MNDLIALLEEKGVRYGVIDGQAVNYYAEPLVSLDLDLVVAMDRLDEAESSLRERFEVQRFPHSLNAVPRDSNLRIQIQTDPRYADFVDRSISGEVLGTVMPVASVEDVLRGKLWAAQDPSRRASKRQKDLADIARLIEARPESRALVPKELLERLEF